MVSAILDSSEAMWKNFKEMPIILRALTVSVLVIYLFIFVSLSPYNLIIVNNVHITNVQWWKNGMGTLTFLNAVLMTIASILMLRRSLYGRLFFIIGFGLLNVINFYIHTVFAGIGIEISRASYAHLASVVSDVVLMLLLTFYLWKSEKVNKYFANESIHTANTGSANTHSEQ